jgi:hypothetical protein
VLCLSRGPPASQIVLLARALEGHAQEMMWAILGLFFFLFFQIVITNKYLRQVLKITLVHNG